MRTEQAIEIPNQGRPFLVNRATYFFGALWHSLYHKREYDPEELLGFAKQAVFLGRRSLAFQHYPKLTFLGEPTRSFYAYEKLGLSPILSLEVRGPVTDRARKRDLVRAREDTSDRPFHPQTIYIFGLNDKGKLVAKKVISLPEDIYDNRVPKQEGSINFVESGINSFDARLLQCAAQPHLCGNPGG
ncbi:hypothetical protein HYS91_05265 [Candidatus Daviesbacteria bacterium]|nr:hypothetical protein [Candidatus Daviesbacteria bacterium]